MLKLLLAAVLSLLSLTACNGTLQTGQASGLVFDVATVAADLAALDTQFEAAAETALRAADAGDNRLSLSIDRMRDLREGVHALIGNSGDVTTALVQVDEVRYLYLNARLAYSDARAQVSGRFGTLSPLDQIVLQRFDDRAKRLDVTVARLLAAPATGQQDITSILSDLLMTGATVAKLVALAGV